MTTRRPAITYLVALFLLGAATSAHGSTGTPGPSCATLAHGATTLLVNRDGRIYKRAVSGGRTYIYGCFNGAPHTRLLEVVPSARGVYPAGNRNFQLVGGYAGRSANFYVPGYGFEQPAGKGLLEVYDLVHGGRTFSFEPRQQVRDGFGSTSITRWAMNRYGRVVWLYEVALYPAYPGHPSDDYGVLVHDRMGTRTVDFNNGPADTVEIGLRSAAWFGSTHSLLGRELIS